MEYCVARSPGNVRIENEFILRRGWTGQGLPVNIYCMEFKLNTDFIELDNLLKASGIAENGAEAKLLIQAGKVFVNAVVETKIRRKLRRGDRVVFETSEILLA